MDVVLGANGFLGKAVSKEVNKGSLLLTRKEWDLTTAAPFVEDLSTLSAEAKIIDVVYYCADFYPGISYASKNQLEVYEKNVFLTSQLIDFCLKNKVSKVITVGTTGCYPQVDELLSEDMFSPRVEKLNPSLVGYASSRFTMLDMLRVSGLDHTHMVLPNLYGPGDRFELGRSHLLSSWVRDFIKWTFEKDSIELWGSPKAAREFMYTPDAAKYMVAASKLSLPEVLNVGYDLVPDYETLAKTILECLGSEMPVSFDMRPTARLREAMDVSLFKSLTKELILPNPTVFKTGVLKTIMDFKKNNLAGLNE